MECIFGRWCLVLLGKSKYFATKRWMYKNVVLGWNSQERRDLSSLRDESKYIYSLEQWARLFFLFISSKNKRYCLVLRSLKMISVCKGIKNRFFGNNNCYKSIDFVHQRHILFNIFPFIDILFYKKVFKNFYIMTFKQITAKLLKNFRFFWVF